MLHADMIHGQMGWIEARKRCEGRGAALLSLTDRRQNAGLVKLVR